MGLLALLAVAAVAVDQEALPGEMLLLRQVLILAVAHMGVGVVQVCMEIVAQQPAQSELSGPAQLVLFPRLAQVTNEPVYPS